MRSLCSFGLVVLSALVLGLAAFLCSRKPADLLAGTLLALFASMLVWALLYRLFPREWRGSAKRGLAVILLVSSMLCSGSVVVYKNSNGTCYLYGEWDDDYHFDQYAIAVFEANATTYREAVEILTSAGTGTFNPSLNYSIGVGWLYRGLAAFGVPPNPAYPRVINVFCHGFSAMLLYAVAIRAGLSFRAARFALYLTGLSPVLVFNAINTYRDAIVVTCISATLFAVAQITVAEVAGKRERGDLALGTALGVGGLLGAGFLRTGYASVMAAILVGAILVEMPRRYRVPVLCCMTGTLTIGILFAEVLPLFVGMTKAHLEEFRSWNIERITRGGQSNILSWVFNMPEALAFLVRVVIRNLMPLPMLTGGRITPDIFYQIGTLVWLVMLPYVVKGVRQAFSARDWSRSTLVRAAFIFLVAFFLVSAWGSMQARHAATYIPAAALLAGRGYGDSLRLFDYIITGVCWLCIGVLILYGVFR